ncbi:TolB family protein [Actinoplanes regularis]|uniref:TolB family protein n=1 Tax=Actinoplanes regularis TaxID=52697 RepID=UPI0024A3CAD7|nr:hypothetical protein [Actinoplanes regularis]GLW33185.1 hypothetical protein Areg01_61230 [Actinoplanes regularis]
MRRFARERTIVAAAVLAASTGALLGEGNAAAAADGTTLRVSVARDGSPANDPSVAQFISADGRSVAFVSAASNLVTGRTDRTRTDVFVRDPDAATTVLASVAADGTAGDRESRSPSLSADGRYVAFQSAATNLVAGDTNDQTDIFVRDLLAGVTTRVSVAGSGAQADGFSQAPSISADGRYVAFVSRASNLVPGGSASVTADVYVHDRDSGTTTRVSVPAVDATEQYNTGQPRISPDGRFVVYVSDSPRQVADDTNRRSDVILYDRQADTRSRISVAAGGVQGNGSSSDPTISADNRYVGFASSSTNLVAGDTNRKTDVFVYDRQLSRPVRVSVSSQAVEADGESGSPAISAEGRYVTYASTASNLVEGDTNNGGDVFVTDLSTGTTERVTVSDSGAQVNASVTAPPSISGDGRSVVFTSNAPGLTPRNAVGHQVYLRRR